MKRGFAFVLAALAGLAAGFFALSCCGKSFRSPSPAFSSPAVSPAASRSYGGGHCFAGLPKPTSYPNPLTVLTNAGYIAAYDEKRKAPVWVCYRLFKADNRESATGPDLFATDARIASRVTPADYDQTGYDPGLLAPAGPLEVCYGEAARREAFLMSNVIPRTPRMNRGKWEDLARLERRDWVRKFGELWVVTGGVFPTQPRKLASGVDVPECCYKIVVAEESGRPRILAFLMPQDPQDIESLDIFLVTVDDLEQVTGLDFFSELPDELENKVEVESTVHVW